MQVLSNLSITDWVDKKIKNKKTEACDIQYIQIAAPPLSVFLLPPGEHELCLSV